MTKKNKIFLFVLTVVSVISFSVFPVGASSPESFRDESDIKSYFEQCTAGSKYTWDKYNHYIVYPQDDGNYFYFYTGENPVIYRGQNFIIPIYDSFFVIAPNGTVSPVEDAVLLPTDFSRWYRSDLLEDSGHRAESNIKDFYALYTPTEIPTEKPTAPSIESSVDHLATILNRLDIVTTIMLFGFGFTAVIFVLVLLYKFLRSCF